MKQNWTENQTEPLRWPLNRKSPTVCQTETLSQQVRIISRLLYCSCYCMCRVELYVCLGLGSERAAGTTQMNTFNRWSLLNEWNRNFSWRALKDTNNNTLADVTTIMRLKVTSWIFKQVLVTLCHSSVTQFWSEAVFVYYLMKTDVRTLRKVSPAVSDQLCAAPLVEQVNADQRSDKNTDGPGHMNMVNTWIMTLMCDCWPDW